MDKNELTKSIKEILGNIGFHQVGISHSESPPKSKLLNDWLNKNYHGEMEWMEDHREKRSDVQKLFPGVKSIVSIAQNYYSPQKHSYSKQHGKISRYAWGEDYHTIIKKKLKQALKQIEKLDEKINGRICVDTAPAMDKIWAEKSGIGWQGKHTNIISKEYGSWIFLGELLLNIELEYDKPMEDFCGQCTACIDACPTDAIVQPYVLDSRKCISYLTIEFREKQIPQKYQNKMENWIFGCDICQDVCPWNKFQKPTDEPRYLPDKQNVKPNLSNLEEISEKDFKEKFKKSPIKRAKWDGFKRNIYTVLQSNQKNE